jgi:hypothetical protein
MRGLVVGWAVGVLVGVVVTAQHAACPCSNRALCEPLGPPRLADREYFQFSTTTAWQSYNWTYISTLAIADFSVFDPNVVCAAHAVNGTLSSPDPRGT